jgi:hypothetical protein
MFRLLSFLAFYLLILNPIYGQKKSKVTTGVFINSIYDLNFPEESFKIDMWLWCTYTDTSLKMNELIEFPKTKEFSFSNDVTVDRSSYKWLTMRANGEVIKKWDCKTFPFDKQILNVSLGYSFDTTTCIVVADVKNSKIDPDFKIAGWNIDKLNCNGGIKTYKTTFGDPSLKDGKSTYPEFNMDIYISRKGSMMTLLKLILGLIIAFTISCCVFFIKPINTDPRFGLCVGGLFTAVGNKYITDGLVPSTNEMTLVDNLHLITFISIFLIIIQSVISLRIYEIETEKSIVFSKKLDLYSFGIIVILFFGTMSAFVLNSIVEN